MSYKQTSYVAKPVDAKGDVAYTEEENAVWNELIVRQRKIIQNRACKEYIAGLEMLALPEDRVPQCREVTAVLQEATGWALEPVPSLIPFDKFFYLLANRKFPAATFIRTREELDYLKEPDIFHEVFGHCPLLTNPAYADFTHTYGKLGLDATAEERVLLARLFWFTVEFGLIETPQGLRAYGGGILSSSNETVYCLEDKTVKYVAFDLVTALHTSYRIDVIQPTYFVIRDFSQLFELTKLDLMKYIREARDYDKQAPQFPC